MKLCGCRCAHYSDDFESKKREVIVYCPLHEYAEELLETLDNLFALAMNSDLVAFDNRKIAKLIAKASSMVSK